MKKHIYANIICDAERRPLKAIVVHGSTVTYVPLSNSRLATVKRTLRDIYRVTDIYVSVLLPDGNEEIDHE